jgi:hypothetical protein
MMAVGFIAIPPLPQLPTARLAVTRQMMAVGFIAPILIP